MKKCIYLLFILFIVTGCEATYTIDIDRDFNENLIVTPNGSEELNKIFEKKYIYPAYYDEDNYEDNDYDSTDGLNIDELDPNEVDDDFFEDFTGDNEDPVIEEPVKRYNALITDKLYYYYTFKDDYQDSFIANYATSDFTAINSSSANSYSSISASDFSFIFNEYPELDKITINIRTSKNVVSNNADKVNGSTYTWVVTKNNPGRRIKITYSDDRYYTQTEKSYDFDTFSNSISSILNSDVNPDTDAVSDLEAGESSSDSNNNNPSNNGNNSNNNKDNKSNLSNNDRHSNLVLYVLYTLFFGLIFGIIIFRTFKNNIKIKK